MKFGIALAAACFALISGTVQSSANEVGTSSSASTTASVALETGYVTTQGRRGGGFRAGGGGRNFGGGRRNFGRNVGIGVGAAVLGGIIANEAYRSRGGGNCRSWSYQCNNGSGYACRQLDRYC
jgi:hypothetical protein